MPTARHRLAGAASIGYNIFVFGGRPQPGDLSAGLNEIFHVISRRWIIIYFQHSSMIFGILDMVFYLVSVNVLDFGMIFAIVKWLFVYY